MMLAEFNWDAIFFNPLAIPIIAIVSVFTWLIIASISESISNVMNHRADVDLKMELFSQGVPADEIVRIVEAGRPGESAGQQHSHYCQTKPHAAPIHGM